MYKVKKNILEFNKETEEWELIGTMKLSRGSPGVSTISETDFAPWCT